MKAIKQGAFLHVRGTSAQGLTARGRIMRSPMDQLVAFTSPNRYENIMLEHVTGPLKGLRMHFSTVLARTSRIKENTCLCEAYGYPHKRGTGECNETR